MNMDPANGLGRILFTTLSQFAEISGHPALANAKVILPGVLRRGPSLCPNSELCTASRYCRDLGVRGTMSRWELIPCA